MLLVSVSALESNTASKDTINDSASVVVCLFRLRPNLAEDDRSWLMEEQTGTDLAPQKAPHFSLLSLLPCVRVVENNGKGRSPWCLGRTKSHSLLGTKKTVRWLFPGCLANQRWCWIQNRCSVLAASVYLAQKSCHGPPEEQS